MAEIKCPHCQSIFQVNESDYQQIVAQVHDQQFNKELALAKDQINSHHQLELAQMRHERQLLEEKLTHAKDLEKAALAKQASQYQLELEKLQAQSQQSLAKLQSDYETQVRLKDEEIARYKDFKAKQSVKLLGESLEQHCENEFNRWRATAFMNAQFHKDNDASSGSKGDYIFRDYDGEVELVSIMFEMKNEADTSTNKKRNEDYFDKLDRDRKNKKCDYAILVSMLEPDNELYNTGIVDVSYRYEKMYVIRPQFFIPMITLIRNEARKTSQLRHELVEMKTQNMDITNFEKKLYDFKDSFSKNVEQAEKRFQTAIDEIDKTISHLTKVRDNLLSSSRQLDLANKKVDNLTIQKLTYQNPTMKALLKKG